MTATNTDVDADERADEDEQTYDPTIRSYSEYFDKIDFMAECIEEKWDEYDYDDIFQLIHQDVSGSRMTFNYAQAQRVLLHSDTRPTEVDWEVYVDDREGTAAYTEYLTAWAHAIVKHDVRERLQRRDNIDEL